MEKLLAGISGKRADIYCGNSVVFRGKVESVTDDVVELSDENGRVFFISLDHVIAVSETNEGASRPGFLS